MNARPQTRATAREAGGTRPGLRTWTLAVCFLVVLLDGLDTTSIAFVAPSLGRAWGLAGAAFTPAFVATSVGAVIGYMAGGPLAQRFGPRPVGLLSVALFGVGTLLTATASDVASLSLMRLVSAIGLGGALPIAIAAAAGTVPQHLKVTAAMLAATGFSAGAVIGGLIGGPLIADLGWPSVFIVGGALPLLLLPAFGRVLATKAGAMTRAQSAPPVKGNPIAALFRDGLGVRTGLLWLFAFLVFLAAYALAFWIPTLLTEFGFSPDQAPLGAAASGVGGLAGSILIVAVVGRLGVERVLMLTSLSAIMCITALSQVSVPRGLVLLLIAGTGAGLISGSVGQSALAVSLSGRATRDRRRLGGRAWTDRLDRGARGGRGHAVLRLAGAGHRADRRATDQCCHPRAGSDVAGRKTGPTATPRRPSSRAGPRREAEPRPQRARRSCRRIGRASSRGRHRLRAPAVVGCLDHAAPRIIVRTATGQVVGAHGHRPHHHAVPAHPGWVGVARRLCVREPRPNPLRLQSAH